VQKQQDVMSLRYPCSIAHIACCQINFDMLCRFMPSISPAEMQCKGTVALCAKGQICCCMLLPLLLSARQAHLLPHCCCCCMCRLPARGEVVRSV
jgi:hypothetical protein